MVNNKHAFWQALVVAVFIFGFGLMAGFFLESYRADVVQDTLLGSEISVLDEQLRGRVVDNFNVSCTLVEENLVEFADRIYFEARNLELLDGSTKFTNSLFILHKRYDLLRAFLWSESIKYKSECDTDFNTVVYIYEYETEDNEKKARQSFYSRLLLDLKKKHPDEVLLIPIAGDMGLSSVDLILDGYDVEKLPVIIINEEHFFDDIVTLEELENVILESNKE